MKSIIKEIYYGNRGECDTIKVEEEYNEAYAKYSEIYDKLFKSLNDEQKQLLDRLYIQEGVAEGEMCATHFKEGFKIGLLIAIEALAEL